MATYMVVTSFLDGDILTARSPEEHGSTPSLTNLACITHPQTRNHVTGICSHPQGGLDNKPWQNMSQSATKKMRQHDICHVVPEQHYQAIERRESQI